MVHGDDNQIVPIGAAAPFFSKLVKGSTLKVYAGAPLGMYSSLRDKVTAELLAFCKDAATFASA